MESILTGVGLAFPAGLNAYIPLFALGLMARFTNLVTLSPPYDFLASDLGLILVAVLMLVEMTADKIAIVDHANDVIQSFIRPAAGAILMLSTTGAVDHLDPTLAAVIGIVVTGSVHAVKAASRPAVSASTAGVGNPLVSLIEDMIAAVASVFAILIPLVVPVILLLLLITVGFGIRRLRRRRSRRRGIVHP